MKIKFFIGNLNFAASAADLLERFPSVITAYVAGDGEGNSKGFGFIETEDKYFDDANHGTVFASRTISVTKANNQQPIRGGLSRNNFKPLKTRIEEFVAKIRNSECKAIGVVMSYGAGKYGSVYDQHTRMIDDENEIIKTLAQNADAYLLTNHDITSVWRDGSASGRTLINGTELMSWSGRFRFTGDRVGTEYAVMGIRAISEAYDEACAITGRLPRETEAKKKLEQVFREKAETFRRENCAVEVVEIVATKGGQHFGSGGYYAGWKVLEGKVEAVAVPDSYESNQFTSSERFVLRAKTETALVEITNGDIIGSPHRSFGMEGLFRLVQTI